MSKFRPIKTAVFIKFLEHKGCYPLKDSGGSHSYWKRPHLPRRITIRKKDKEIPAFHVKTNLKTLGLRFEELEDFMKK